MEIGGPNPETLPLCRDLEARVRFEGARLGDGAEDGFCGYFLDSNKEKAIDNNQKVKLICESATDKKADEIIVMEMKHKTAFCDYFVVMSAPSSVRVKTICDHIEATLKEEDYRVAHREGYTEGVWVLLDFGSVIVHVFHQDARKFYEIEHLWGDVPKKPYIHHASKS